VWVNARAHRTDRRDDGDRAHPAHAGPSGLSLEEEVKEIDSLLKTLVAERARGLNAVDGEGTDVASALLAGGRGPPSSGKQVRHCLNRKEADLGTASPLTHPCNNTSGAPRGVHQVLKDPKPAEARVVAVSEAHWHMDDFRCANRLARSAHPPQVGGNALD